MYIIHSHLVSRCCHYDSSVSCTVSEPLSLSWLFHLNLLTWNIALRHSYQVALPLFAVGNAVLYESASLLDHWVGKAVSLQTGKRWLLWVEFAYQILFCAEFIYMDVAANSTHHIWLQACNDSSAVQKKPLLFCFQQRFNRQASLASSVYNEVAPKTLELLI